MFLHIWSLKNQTEDSQVKLNKKNLIRVYIPDYRTLAAENSNVFLLFLYMCINTGVEWIIVFDCTRSI